MKESTQFCWSTSPQKLFIVIITIISLEGLSFRMVILRPNLVSKVKWSSYDDIIAFQISFKLPSLLMATHYLNLVNNAILNMEL